MAAPEVSEFTDRWWGTLPQVHRRGDEAQEAGPDGFPLKRFLSLLGDQADEIAVLHDRMALHDDGTGDWVSDLGNPATADTVWLDWLSWLAGTRAELGTGTAETFDQLVADYATFDALQAANGSFDLVRHHALIIPGGPGPDAVRQSLLAIADLDGPRYAGSTGDWERILRPLLTGKRQLFHQRIFGGDPWHLRFVTYYAETPTPTTVAYVIAHTEAAAGLLVDHEVRLGSSFDDVAAGFATFDAIVAALPTFFDLDIWLP